MSGKIIQPNPLSYIPSLILLQEHKCTYKTSKICLKRKFDWMGNLDYRKFILSPDCSVKIAPRLPSVNGISVTRKRILKTISYGTVVRIDIYCFQYFSSLYNRSSENNVNSTLTEYCKTQTRKNGRRTRKINRCYSKIVQCTYVISTESPSLDYS
jgi:hypothetical protein